EKSTELRNAINAKGQELAANQKTLHETQAQLQQTRGALQSMHEQLNTTRAELQKVIQDRTDREGEVKLARNELARVTGVLRNTETAKAHLEESLTGQIGQLKAQYSEAKGNYEAEKAAHEALQEESGEEIGTLVKQRDELAKKFEAASVSL